VRLLHAALQPGRGVRLIGLTAINLADAQQLTLFDEPGRQDRLTESIDALRHKFGTDAVTRAGLLNRRDRRRPDFGQRPTEDPDKALTD
jgi:hypothetical protein